MPYVSPKPFTSPTDPSSSSTSTSSSTSFSNPSSTSTITDTSIPPQPTSDDLLTPRPQVQPMDPTDALSTQLSSTHLSTSPSIPTEAAHDPIDLAQMSNSTSTTSLTSLSTTTSSLPSDGLTTPPTTSHGTPDGLDGVQVAGSGEDRVARYRQDLYAYTVSLNLPPSTSTSIPCRGIDDRSFLLSFQRSNCR